MGQVESSWIYRLDKFFLLLLLLNSLEKNISYLSLELIKKYTLIYELIFQLNYTLMYELIYINIDFYIG